MWIGWSVDGDGRGSLCWREEGGPTVTAPTRKGFGARLLEGGLGTNLGGKPELIFESGGVRARLPLPIE